MTSITKPACSRRLDDYLTELSTQKAKADKIIAANATETDPDLIRPVPDFPAKTWQILRTAGKLPPSRVNIPYSPRKDGIGRDVPNIVLKVPTGGGKTYLAVSALSRIFGRYLGQSTGLVLWIVPNEAILQPDQAPAPGTPATVSCRARRALRQPHAAAGEDRQAQAQAIVQGQRCVMLLMLPSGKRQDKQTLKLLRDIRADDVHGLGSFADGATASECVSQPRWFGFQRLVRVDRHLCSIANSQMSEVAIQAFDQRHGRGIPCGSSLADETRKNIPWRSVGSVNR